MDDAIALGQRTRKLALPDIRGIHRALLASTRDSAQGGVIRTAQNWIGGHSDGPKDADFIPPPPEHVSDLLDDLCEFAARDDLPPVVQAAVVHAQFETIHPFADGNGRVGRCLIHVILRRRRLALRYVPPVSLVLGGNARAYIAGLTDYRSGGVAGWCGVFAAAMRTAAVWATRFAEKVQNLQRRWVERAGHPRADSAVAKLIPRLPAQPVIDVKAAEEICDCSNQAARLALLQMEKAGVLRQVTVGKRNRAWEATELFDLLNRFERDLARPKPDGRPGRRVPARGTSRR